MLSLLIVLALDGALLEELARRGPVVTVEEKAPKAGIVVRAPKAAPPASADKPDCPIRIGGGDNTLLGALRMHEVKPPVDAFMAVPGRCNPKAIR